MKNAIQIKDENTGHLVFVIKMTDTDFCLDTWVQSEGVHMRLY